MSQVAEPVAPPSARDVTASEATRRSRGRTIFVAYWALTAVHLAPLLLWPIPRSADLINHWARLTLMKMPASDPLSAFYIYKLRVIPNLAIDLIYFAASPLASPLAVVQIAWIASIVLPASGVWRLNRALYGEPQLSVLLAPFLAYNLVVAIGLVNFAIGVGLALHIIALWLTIDRSRIALRLIVFNAAGVALFFCHIASYGLFLLTVLLIEANPKDGDTIARWTLRCAQTPLFVCLALALWPLTEPVDDRLGPAPAFALLRYLAAFWSGDAQSDLAAFVGFLALAGFGLFRRELKISWRMALPVVGLAVIVALLPSGIGAASLLAGRINVFLALLCVGSLGWRAGGGDFVMTPTIAAVFCVLRVALAAPEWSRYEERVGELRREIAVIQPGQRVLEIAAPQSECADRLTHLQLTFDEYIAEFAVIDRRAMVSSLFTGRGMQPLRLRDPALARFPWSAFDASLLDDSALSSWRSQFDVLLVFHGACAWRPRAPGLNLIAQGSHADVYGISAAQPRAPDSGDAPRGSSPPTH